MSDITISRADALEIWDFLDEHNALLNTRQRAAMDRLHAAAYPRLRRTLSAGNPAERP